MLGRRGGGRCQEERRWKGAGESRTALGGWGDSDGSARHAALGPADRKDQADGLDDEGHGAQELLDHEAAENHLELRYAGPWTEPHRPISVQIWHRFGDRLARLRAMEFAVVGRRRTGGVWGEGDADSSGNDSLQHCNCDVASIIYTPRRAIQGDSDKQTQDVVPMAPEWAGLIANCVLATKLTRNPKLVSKPVIRIAVAKFQICGPF